MAPLHLTDPSFTPRPPRLGSFEPALFFPAASLLTAGVPIGNRKHISLPMLLPFLHSPVSKIQHQLPPTRTQFALVSFDRWQQQVLMHRF